MEQIDAGAYNIDKSKHKNEMLNYDNKPIFPIVIKDTFADLLTKNIMRGRELNDWDERIISEVIKYYTNKYSPLGIGNNVPAKIIKILKNCTKEHDFSYKKLLELTKCDSTECVIGYALLAFKDYDSELLIRTINTFGRVKPIETKDTWFDNWRLNALCSSFNLLVWKEHDKNDNWSIDKNFIDINENINCNFDNIRKFMIGPLRSFIIEKGLIQVTMKDYIKDPIIEQQLSDKTICDLSYKYYPFYYLGSHGCNALIEGSWTSHINTIKSFLDRYPAAICGGIFNTSTYNMEGKHWVAIVFYNKDGDPSRKKALLLCSQASNWDAFAIYDKINIELINNGFALENNNITIQIDNSSCGVYSVLSIFAMLSNNCDIQKSINMIGKNAEGLSKYVGGKKVNIDTIKETIAGWVEKTI